MANVFDVKADELIEKAAEELKKMEFMKMPEWAKFVKTSTARERPPIKPDWWYTRAASILRKLYILDKPIGTNKLKSYYGGRKNRGHKPEKMYKGSGKIIRLILQQLEKAEFIKKTEKGVHKGRIITKKGKSFLDKLINKNGFSLENKGKPLSTQERKE
ncbi:MAG: 30S ribosomal protein S19e [Nanoarchaeota archaeon]